MSQDHMNLLFGIEEEKIETVLLSYSDILS